MLLRVQVHSLSLDDGWMCAKVVVNQSRDAASSCSLAGREEKLPSRSVAVDDGSLQTEMHFVYPFEIEIALVLIN